MVMAKNAGIGDNFLINCITIYYTKKFKEKYLHYYC